MTTYDVDDSDRAVVTDDRSRVVENRTSTATMPAWSPAQFIGLIGGIGFVVLGIAAVARTGFDTAHIYTPQAIVWHLPHTPLLGAIEIGFGALLVIASVVPGAMRTLMTLLGAISLAFGLVVLFEEAPNRLNGWLGVTHRSGWLFAIFGGVIVLAALLSPVFGGGVRNRVNRDERVVSQV